MRRFVLMSLMLIIVIYLTAETTSLWQTNGVPLIESNYIRWNGGSAQDSNGNTMIVWTENKGDNHDLYGMLLNADGENSWDAPCLLLNRDYTMIDPRISTSSDGLLYISWVEGLSDYPIYIRFSKFNWDGTHLWDAPIELTDVSYEYDNIKLIPDNEGGVYVNWDTSGSWYATRYNGDGTPAWDPAIQEVYDGYASLISDQTLSEDGHGGFIAVGNIYVDSSRNTIVSRILPDGSTPWGDDGYVMLDADEEPCIHLCNNDEIVIVAADDNNSGGQSLYFYHLNMDGELLTENPTILANGVPYSFTINITHDADNNVFVSWSGSSDDIVVHNIKVSPNNEVVWTNNYQDDDLDVYPQQIKSGVDQAGNLYQSSLDYTGQLHILKLTTDGQLVWSAVESGQDDYYLTYVDLVMDVGDDGATLYWADASTGSVSIYKQIYDGNGTPTFTGDDRFVEEGYDLSLSNLHFADSEQEPVDEFFFAWDNYYDLGCYLQNLQLDGNLLIDTPGLKFAESEVHQNRIVTVEKYGDDYLIVWITAYDEFKNLYVNQFDSQGNRIWANDLFVRQFDSSYSLPYYLTTEMYNDELILCWEEAVGNGNYYVKGQKVVNGQLAWDIPATFYPSADISYVRLYHDYLIVEDANNIRVLKIGEDGDPAYGWDQDGVLVADPYYLYGVVAEETEEGLLIAWLGDAVSPFAIKMNIVTNEATLKWNQAQTLVPTTQVDYFYGDVVDGMLYLVWDCNGLYAGKFNLDAEPQWDDSVLISSSVDSPWDIARTPDGIMITYTDWPEANNGNEILINHVDWNGNTWDEAETVCDCDGYRQHISMIPAADNKYLITWNDYRDVYSYNNVYGQLYQYNTLDNDGGEEISSWNPNLITYPNPFNPETTVQFNLAQDQKVELKIYNTKGQLVKTFCNEVLSAGDHHIKWDGTDKTRKNVASGVYLMNLKIDGKNYRSKALLLK